MFGKRRSYTCEEGKVRIRFENGTAEIIPLTEEIIRVYAPLSGKEIRSKAIEGDKAQGVYFKAGEREECLEITTAGLIVRVYDDFKVDFYDKAERLLCADYRGDRRVTAPISEKFKKLLKAEGHDTSDLDNRNYRVQVVKQMEGDEAFYGLGDKTGYLNKRHYAYEMWNSDLPAAHTEAFPALYKSVPFFITRRKSCVFGIYFDNTYHSWFDMGKEQPDYYYFGADEGNLDYYFLAGGTMAEIVGNYTYLTGRTPLPQLFTLGYHQSRWGYETAEDVLAVAKKYRDLRIPIDTIHLDIDYMQDYKVFTWNDREFKEPGELTAELSRQGYKTVAVIDPGVKVEEGYFVYDEGRKHDYFVKTPDNEVYINEVWPGEAVFPDFGKKEVRTWWADKQKLLVDMGLRGVWNDMNEPASFRGELPAELVFTDEDEPSSHAAMHNVYGHQMAKAAYEGFRRYDGRRPFVLSRACYSGSQKYTTVWTGDNQSLWEHLRMAIPQLCNMGLSGLAFAGTDVGGFGADVTPELLSRWVQLGCFSPLFRNHSSKGSIRQEPWLFGRETLEINRQYISLRYRLLPYFYDLFWECERNGLPPMRPLVLHYEQDENVRELNSEFLLGRNMLIAPVVEQGMHKKLVYLPEGSWYDYWTKEKVEGGRYLVRNAPIDVCPVYVRSGGILPNYEPVQYVGEKEQETLILDVYSGNGHYIHYQDNGEDFAYRDGGYNAYEILLSEDGTLKIELIHEGYDRKYQRIAVSHNGHMQEFAFSGKRLTVWL